MVFKPLLNIKNSQKGVSLVEVIIVIFIIIVLSSILVADFPQMQKRFALSRAAYKLAQDFRRAQDLGLSGVTIKNFYGSQVLAKGYGIFVSLNTTKTVQYIIYADVDGDQRYLSLAGSYCSQQTDIRYDCIIEKIDISKDSPDLYIKEFKNINNTFTSINFSPPSPKISIGNKCVLQCNHSPDSEAGVVLGLTDVPGATRTVWVNTSGLIRIE